MVESITDGGNLKETKTKPSEHTILCRIDRIQYYVSPIFQRFPSKHIFPFEYICIDKYIYVIQ